jgi:hypothetical protein
VTLECICHALPEIETNKKAGAENCSKKTAPGREGFCTIDSPAVIDIPCFD